MTQAPLESLVRSLKVHTCNVHLFLRDNFRITNTLRFEWMIPVVQEEAKRIPGRGVHLIKPEASSSRQHRVFSLRDVFQPPDHRNIKARESKRTVFCRFERNRERWEYCLLVPNLDRHKKRLACETVTREPDTCFNVYKIQGKKEAGKDHDCQKWGEDDIQEFV